MTKVEEILDEFCSGRATLAAAEAALQQGRSSGVIDEAQLRAVVDRFVSDGRLAAEAAARLAGLTGARVEAADATVFRPAGDTARGLGGAPSGTVPHSGASGTSAGWRKWASEETTGGRVGVGTILRDRFVIEEAVGEGGMGLVFRARDRRREEANDRNPFVAIKVLGEDFKTHPDALISLQREARRMQQLSHPNIASVYDFDRDGSHVYLVMELLEGESLDRILERHPNVGLPREQALKVIEGAGSALRHAHSRGLVHSDFKPANVFVTRSGEVKVIDFGIARIAKDATHVGDAAMTLFDAGKLGAWTNAYASPEQMLDGATPDARDDVYALGLVAYEALAGMHPFGRKSAVEAKFREMKVAPVPVLSDRQNAVLASALHFDRDHRLADTMELVRSLNAPDGDAPPAPITADRSRHAESQDAGTKPKGKGRAIALAIAGLAWLGFFVVQWSARQGSDAPSPKAEAGRNELDAAKSLVAPDESTAVAKAAPEASVQRPAVAKPVRSPASAATERPKPVAESPDVNAPVPSGSPVADIEPALAAGNAPETSSEAPAEPAPAGATGQSAPALYRWVDRNGVVQFGEKPPDEYADDAVKLVD